MPDSDILPPYNLHPRARPENRTELVPGLVYRLFLGELVIIDTETAAQRLATEQGISVEDARLAIRSQEVAIRLGDLASLRYQTLDLASKVLMGLLALGAAALLELVLPSAFRLATLGGWLLLTGYVASERSKHKPPKSLAEALK